MRNLNKSAEKESQYPTADMQKEILAFSSLLKEYNITFSDLINSSPNESETRAAAMRIPGIINANRKLLNLFQSKKRVPIKELQQYDSSFKETLSNYQNYIMALTLLHLGKFTLLRKYIAQKEEYLNTSVS